MIERPVYVIDASVVTRWHLANPPYLEQALRVRDDYANRRIRLLAPDNLYYEVAGSIRRAVSAKAIQAAHGKQMVEDFTDWRTTSHLGNADGEVTLPSNSRS